MKRMPLMLGIACMLLLPAALYAQSGKTRFAHSAGLSLYTNNDNYLSAGLMYSPRFNFVVLSEKSTFSIGTHLGLGSHIDDEKVAGMPYGFGLVADVPVVVEYNFGNAATRIANTRHGGFVGAGYGWHSLKHDKSYGYESPEGYYIPSRNMDLNGPIINAGYRFSIGRASFGVRMAYLFNINPSSEGVPGLGSIATAFNIGTWLRKR